MRVRLLLPMAGQRLQSGARPARVCWARKARTAVNTFFLEGTSRICSANIEHATQRLCFPSSTTCTESRVLRTKDEFIELNLQNFEEK